MLVNLGQFFESFTLCTRSIFYEVFKMHFLQELRNFDIKRPSLVSKLTYVLGALTFIILISGALISGLQDIGVWNILSCDVQNPLLDRQFITDRCLLFGYFLTGNMKTLTSFQVTFLISLLKDWCVIFANNILSFFKNKYFLNLFKI